MGFCAVVAVVVVIGGFWVVDVVRVGFVFVFIFCGVFCVLGVGRLFKQSNLG